MAPLSETENGPPASKQKAKQFKISQKRYLLDPDFLPAFIGFDGGSRIQKASTKIPSKIPPTKETEIKKHRVLLSSLYLS